MSENINGKTFKVSHCGVNLPFEMYSMEYIWNELKSKASHFGKISKLEHATKDEIENYYRDNKKDLGENTRHFAYIKFFHVNDTDYGLVAGKTNYTRPDLLFDYLDGEKDHRYARIFLKNTSDAAWSDTIIIVNHKPSASEEEDKQAALFIECYLQRKFNLFNS